MSLAFFGFVFFISLTVADVGAQKFVLTEGNESCGEACDIALGLKCNFNGFNDLSDDAKKANINELVDCGENLNYDHGKAEAQKKNQPFIDVKQKKVFGWKRGGTDVEPSCQARGSAQRIRVCQCGGGGRGENTDGPGPSPTESPGGSGGSITVPEFKTCKGNPDLKTLRANEQAKHNELRRKHGVPDLIEDQKLYDLAHGYIQKYRNSKTLPNHNSQRSEGFDKDVGENLYYACWSAGITYKPGQATQSWYDEIENWDFGSSTGNGLYLHFTQLVWKKTTKVGHGFAFDDDCECIYVCSNYYVMGNMQGEFADNVLPPK